MTMDDDPPFELTIEQAAVVYAVAYDAMRRMIDGDLNDAAYGASVPRGMLTAGQAVMLIPVVVILIRQVYPLLADPEILAAALRDSTPTSPTIN